MLTWGWKKSLLSKKEQGQNPMGVHFDAPAPPQELLSLCFVLFQINQLPVFYTLPLSFIIAAESLRLWQFCGPDGAPCIVPPRSHCRNLLWYWSTRLLGLLATCTLLGRPPWCPPSPFGSAWPGRALLSPQSLPRGPKTVIMNRCGTDFILFRR